MNNENNTNKICKNDKKERAQKKPLFYRFVRNTVKAFYSKRKILNTQYLQSEPAVYIGNHAQIHGPLFAELMFPKPCMTWCAGEIMDKATAPEYIYDDFWPNKNPKKLKSYKRLSKMIAPLAVYLFSNSYTIAVHHDARGVGTFKSSVQALCDGKNIVIFPECRTPFNHIVNDFQDKFVDLARFYYKKTGKCLKFVPMYNASKLKKVVFGEPIAFDPSADIETERKRICDYLKDKITSLAVELPKHRVVPYTNIKKKFYPYNK